jgi:ABC-type transport system substrate-binding protein
MQRRTALLATPALLAPAARAQSSWPSRPIRLISPFPPGGTWRRGFIGPGDGENGNRIMSADKPLFFDASGTELMPCLCKAWEVSADGRRTTLHLRRGLRWSDGSPHRPAPPASPIGCSISNTSLTGS